ncbi:MAG: cardiolipin synthase [Paenibacillaceae bacterium]|nr:cardiolipin synthase [Paenibacillaceae bacterium]
MWLTIALIIVLFQIITIVCSEFRRPAKGFAWVALLITFPIVGIVMYYFLARDYRRHAKVRRAGLLPHVGLRTAGDGVFDEKSTKIHRLLQTMPDVTVSHHNAIARFASPHEAYERMLADIAHAQDDVHMLYYTWNDDMIGKRMQHALLRKLRDGVRVRIVYDGIGSYATDASFWQTLRDAGAQVYCFLPAWLAFFKKRINYRNHRKLTIIDDAIGYVGGANIGDEYLGHDRKLGYWRDTVVRLHGECVLGLQQCFWRDWQFVTKHAHVRVPQSTAQPPSRATVYVVPSGPDRDGDAILELYFASFVGARTRIWLTTPYFIPDPSLKMALTAAALAGIDVRVIIPGVEDTRISLWASLSFIEELLQHGVRIFRYAKGFMHAKIVIVDDEFSSVGSANIDLRSLYSNFELNTVFFDRAITAQLAADFAQDQQDSVEVLYEQYVHRSTRQRMQEAIGRVIAPLL